MPRPTPFRVALPQSRLDAIRAQIAAFPWHAVSEPAEDAGPWAAGTSLAFMRALCTTWTDAFDWRAQEASINRFPQFIAQIDGIDVHVLHERGSGPHDTALVLTHGWPGSIVEFLHLIDRFAHPERFGGDASDGIDVVVPSLPGFGFSGPPVPAVGPRRVAALWDTLLREVLGYQRYIAQGGDWGSMVSAMAGLDHSLGKGGGCEAIHLNYLGARVDAPRGDDAERAFHERCQPFMQDGRAYAETHRTTPLTLAYAMAENPIGQAAWIIDKFHAWSDLRGPSGERDLREVIPADTLLANVMLYVATGRFATATWIYRAAAAEVMRLLPPGTRIEVPTGFASFPREIRPLPPRGLVERTYHVVQFSEFDRGGHFAALEQPDLFAADVSAFVRRVRETR